MKWDWMEGFYKFMQMSRKDGASRVDSRSQWRDGREVCGYSVGAAGY